MEGIYLVQYYGSTSTRGQNGVHTGFIVGRSDGMITPWCWQDRARCAVLEVFVDVTMSVIRERARALLGRDDEEIPVFVAQEDVLIYDGEI